MLRSNKAQFGAIALALGGMGVLCASDGADKVVKASTRAADKAAKALNRHESAAAIAAAEEAVTLAPRAAAYRMLLGQSYLQAGRFTSAGQAFDDTLQLDGGNGKAALNLALTQIARGDWQAARATLDAHADAIPVSDRGLAMALAGDTAGSVALLTQAARSPSATPKVRQNLALAYALGGQWGIARVVASADMSPADVEARMQQWAAFAQPQGASDQVASLLGVRPVADAGQPTALALNAPAAAPVAVAQAEPVAAPVAKAEPVAVAQAQPVVVPMQVGTTATPVSRVTFAAAKEVVQSLSVPLLAKAGAFKTPVKAFWPRAAAVKPVAAKTTSSGGWHVQLGAFSNAGVAKDAWGRATRRFAAFRGHVPQGMTFRTTKAAFYRLSVGGFSRAGADQACRQYRAHGGVCFVRMNAGDQMAQWVRPSGTMLAMR